MTEERQAEHAPFKVARDGKITDRETGELIGLVRLDSERGWIAYTAAPEYGELWPWRTVWRSHWNGRKYAARAAWDEWQERSNRSGTSQEGRDA